MERLKYVKQNLMITCNTVVDKGLSEEGVPGMADGAINKGVDEEVNKFA